MVIIGRSNCTMRLLILIYLLNAMPTSGTWCHFWRGRRSNGNVGEPDNGPPDQRPLELPPDEYVQQPLDHFDRRNRRTWNQVKNLHECLKIYKIAAV